ncbi:MAG: HD domain-containing protein [Desulfatibacillum sp.]|nr:HD domain-containing protein [Desulfatibacillum sp.]
MEPLQIIQKHYDTQSKAYSLLVNHSTWVAEKAVELAKRIDPSGLDLEFIHQAAMLHDIGIFRVNAPGLDCHGDLHYLLHGIQGREILDAENMPLHGLVCERHVGVGIPRREANSLGMGLPDRDMRPQSTEEKIICYVDKFHSKNGHAQGVVKSVEDIIQGLTALGLDKCQVFTQWMEEFGLP